MFCNVSISTQAYLRVTKPKNDVSTGTMLAGVPLAVIDSAICWWVFTALTTTLRTLRLRRNLVKFTLYRHFTNVLIFSVIASVVFMLINIKLFKLEQCLKGVPFAQYNDCYLSKDGIFLVSTVKIQPLFTIISLF